MKLLTRYVCALGYFTIIPIPRAFRVPPGPEETALLPTIGILVGFASGTLARLLARRLPRDLAASVAFAAPIVFTGALHVDGFLDVCDAAFASVPAERRREILRDPHHGTFAFAAGSIATVCTFAAMREIAPECLPAALALSEGTARLAAVLAGPRSTTAGAGTAARAFERGIDRRTLVVQSLALLALAHRLGGKRLALATIVLASSGFPIATALSRRFAGALTGDAFGFVIFCVNVATLASCAILRP